MNNKNRFDNPERKHTNGDIDILDNFDLALTLKSTRDGVAICNNKGEFIYTNDSYLKTYGYESPEEIIGRSWKLVHHPDEIKKFEEIVIPELNKKGSWIGETTGKKRDGSIIYQELTLTLTNEGRIIRITRDITERKKTQIALEESELKYRSLIENLNEAVLYQDNKNIIIFTNKRFCELFGYGINELEGTNGYDLLYDKNDIEFINGKNNERVKGISDSYEIRLKKKNGDLVWCHINGTPYHDAAGNIVGSITIISDITEHKKSKEALSEYEAKFQAIFESSVDAIGVTINGINILNNPAFVLLFGYNDANEIEGKSEINFIASSERERIMEYTKNRIIGKPVPSSYVTKGLRKDGSEFSLEVHVSGYKLGGEIYEIAILRDITEFEKTEKALRDSEEGYRSLVNTSPDAINVINLEGDIVFLNQRTVEMFGYGDSDEVVGKALSSLIVEEEWEDAKEKINEIITYGYSGNIERRMIKKDGTVFPADINASLIRNSEGNPTAIVAIIRDISKRKHTEEKLRKFAEEQAELNATKDKFYSIIAHDLKSPFQTILGYSEMLDKNIEELEIPRISEYARNIYESANETFNLLDDLLKWTGSQTGRINALPEIIYVKELIDSTTKIFRENADSKKISLTSKVTGDLFVSADRNMITTILRNLLSNAIKFTRAEGEINLTAEEYNGNILISVIDSGIGIPEENIPKLFRVEKAFSTAGTEKEKGTGLGLVICKEFVEKNNGTLSVESTPGKGSKFIVSLPKLDERIY
jgi:PAS domain S-box-containing protein